MPGLSSVFHLLSSVFCLLMNYTARFETAAAELHWLTRSVFVATAERHPSDVIIRVWKVE